MAGPSMGLACENGKVAWVTATSVVWVGIDVGKASHHAVALDASGKKLWSVKVGNSQQSIEELLDRAATTAGDGEVRWAIDLVSPPAALLSAILLSGGQSVVYVPGRVVHGMAGVFRGEGKTDAKDARIIADTARMRSDLTELTVDDELVVELTRLASYRADAMADWVRGINRLRALLTSIFPALEASFDYSTRSALILITGYCTPAGIRRAGAEGLAAHLREHGARGVDKMATQALQAAEQQSVGLPGETTTALLVKRLAKQLLDLDREIKDTDKLLTSRFRDHPQAHIIESLPGMGPILGAQFLVATNGRPLDAFASSGRLASYAGLVPVPRDSGRVSGNYHRPKRYNRPLRQVFYMMALSSLKTEGPSRVFYQRKRDENKIHTQALLALARRMVDVLWALLRDNRTFSTAPPSQVNALAA
jgi:transposase